MVGMQFQEVMMATPGQMGISMKKYLIFILIFPASLFAQSIQHYHSAVIKNKIAAGGATTYTVGDYTWNHLTETNNTSLGYTENKWADTTSSFEISANTNALYYINNVDSGAVWNLATQYQRNASPPAGILGGAFSIEMVVKIARTDSSQGLFGVSEGGDPAIGIGIDASGVFVGQLLEGATNFTHNSSASTGWHHIVFTWDGSSASGVFYLDGSAVSDAGNVGSAVYPSDGRIAMGATGSMNKICAGTLTPFIALHTVQLTAQQVSDNYNSDVIQNQIPAWAR